MGRKGFEKISQREYARRLGVSNEAVSKAVREGKIKTGWSAKEKRIIVEKADKEWGLLHKNTDVSSILDPDDAPAPRPRSEAKIQLNAETPFVEARRINEIIRGQIQALELKKQQGLLVSKDEINNQLFRLGQQLKSNIMNLPDKVIDNILASKSRAEAHLLLTNELHGALESVVKEFSKL